MCCVVTGFLILGLIGNHPSILRRYIASHLISADKDNKSNVAKRKSKQKRNESQTHSTTVGNSSSADFVEDSKGSEGEENKKTAMSPSLTSPPPKEDKHSWVAKFLASENGMNCCVVSCWNLTSMVDLAGVQHSGKFQVLLEILSVCRNTKEKTLIFSKSMPTLGNRARLHRLQRIFNNIFQIFFRKPLRSTIMCAPDWTVCSRSQMM
jgi:hypothetical protein